MMMKLVIVFVLVFVYSNAAPLDKEFVKAFYVRLQEIGEICVPETGATKDDISTLLTHNVPTSSEGQCLIFCFHKKFRIQNEDGSINREGALQELEPLKENDETVYNKVVQVFNTCTDSVSANSNSCKFAADLAECAIREGRALGLHEYLLVD